LAERYLPRVAALGDKRRHSRLLFELGYSYVFSAEGPSGKKFLEQALALGEDLGDAESIGYACLGLLFSICSGGMPATRHAPRSGRSPVV